MSLPNIAKLEITSADLAQLRTPSRVHRTYRWDYEAGDFLLKDGKLVEAVGIEYVREWVRKALHTVRGTRIYSGSTYGSEHYSLIGRNFKPQFAQAEYERMIKEAILQNDVVTRVDNFSFVQSGERLAISFTVHSIYGTTGEELNV